MSDRLKMKFLIILLLAVACFHRGSAKIFTRCELAQELLDRGFLRPDLEDWVCLVENESGRNTAVKGGPNSNGTFDWGLFQINDGYWCKPGDVPGGDCNVTCEDLLTDDITKSVVCTNMIFKRHGFNAWHAWQRKCQEALPDLSSCNLTQ